MMALMISYLPLKHKSDRRLSCFPVTAADFKQKKSKTASVPFCASIRRRDAPRDGTGTKKGTDCTDSGENSVDNPNPLVSQVTFSSLPVAFCNALDKMIDSLTSSPSADPSDVFAGNFAPVDELPPTRCLVVFGKIPTCLVGGAYIRNGPNPQFLPRRRRHNILDGDGMLHSLLFSSDDRAILCSRYVKTHRYMIERDAGCPMIPGTFSGFHGFGGLARGAVTILRALTGQINFAQGIGLANTSVVFLARRLYALGESDLPYAIHVDPVGGEISTIGRFDFDGRLEIAMTAHPKKDPKTGETFAFRCGFFPPFLSYFRFDAEGNKLKDVPVYSIKQPSLVHDFAITENYVLILDNQLVLKPMELMLGRGICIASDKSKVPCLRVLPRYANDVKSLNALFELPGFNMMHSVNAWDEENSNGEKCVVLVASNLLGIEHALERMDLVHCASEMVRINLRTGVVTRTPLSALNLGYSAINPGYMGQKNRYAYFGVGDPNPKVAAIVKLDLSRSGKEDCVVARRNFGPAGCFGGEPFFVPNNESKGEDDGYLVCYVHDEATGESKCFVMSACSPDLEIVAEVLLPQRIPYGFHGLFVPESELHSQLC